jgi:hypothetical protein
VTPDELKALAYQTYKQLAAYANGQFVDEDDVQRIFEALERVQNEAIASRIEWPSEERVRKEMYYYLYSPQSPVQAQAPSAWGVYNHMFKWLRDNIRIDCEEEWKPVIESSFYDPMAVEKKPFVFIEVEKSEYERLKALDKIVAEKRMRGNK